MPDTGAPWNIPYVEAADLVSDWPADSLALANAIDAGLDAAGNAGIGSNVVQAFKDTSFTTTSTSFVDLTGLSVTITPSSATSKILIMVTGGMNGSSSNQGGFMRIVRDATAIALNDGTTYTASTKRAASTSMWNNAATVVLDSPATAVAVTYKLQLAAESGITMGWGTEFLNSSKTIVSSLTAIEVAP